MGIYLKHFSVPTSPKPARPGVPLLPGPMPNRHASVPQRDEEYKMRREETLTKEMSI